MVKSIPMAIKVKIGPKKTKVKVTGKETPSPEALAEANKLAQRLVSQHGGFNAENIHTGGKIPKFYDDAGREVTNLPPSDIGPLPTKVPSYVKSLEWDDKKNLPYYVDEKTGYMQYVPKDMFYSPRFNPNRGQTNITLLSKK